MLLRWFETLRDSSRFGAAVRMQKAGRLEHAKAAFLRLSKRLDDVDGTSPPLLSVRLMALVHLSEVAQQLGEEALAQSSLRRWLSAYERACLQDPLLRNVAVLKDWERWVRARLASAPQQ
jgi:hypothetical protein